MRVFFVILTVVLASAAVAQHWNTTLVGTWTDPALNAQTVFVDGDRAYLTSVMSTVILDVADPAAPQYLGAIDALDDPVTAVAAGDLAVLLEETRSVRLFDVSDPAAPEGLSVITSVEEPADAVLAGELLYVGDGNQVVHVFDVSDPADPTLAGWVITPDEVRELKLAGDLLYVACHQGGLRIYDVSDPANTTPAGLYTAGPCNHVGVAGDLAVLQEPMGLNSVLDVSDPANPAFLGDVLYVAFVRGAHLDPPFAYLGHNTEGIRILDLTDPTEPVEVGYDEPPTFVADFVVHGDLIYEALHDLGLRIVRHDGPMAAPPVAPVGAYLLDPAPNPFNPAVRIAFACDRPRALSVRICDPAGRVVTELATGVFAAGEHAVVWDGRDAGGRAVASGSYRVVMQGDGMSDSRTVTLIK